MKNSGTKVGTKTRNIIANEILEEKKNTNINVDKWNNLITECIWRKIDGTKDGIDKWTKIINILTIFRHKNQKI